MCNVPETCREAQNSRLPDRVSEAHRSIIFALETIEEGSYEDVATFLNIENSKVWKRISELVKMGVIYRPGNKKALRSGRAGNTYRLTEASASNIQASEKALKGLSIADFSRNIERIAKSVPGQQISP